MSLFELLLAIHILAIATWFGSGIAITVIGRRLLAAGPEPFSSFALGAGWWAGRAHPAAGVLLLVTGFGMIADADISLGEPWIVIALGGLVVAMGLGGAVIGQASERLDKGIVDAGGTMTAELRPLADRLLLASQVETAILVLAIVDMVVKPGS